MGGQVEAEVLCEGEEFPERGQCAAFLKGRYGEVENHHGQEGRDNAEKTLEIKFPVRNGLTPCHSAQQLASYQIAAQHKKEIHPGPSETSQGIDQGRFSEDPVMVYKYKYDRQGTEMVQSCESFYRKICRRKVL